MSISDRQSQILEILNERYYASVTELAGLTYTSPSSIRRDLTALQNQGLVQRSHGGVTLPEPAVGVASLQDRMSQNVPLKRRIAKLASRYLTVGQTVLLDGSSTAGFLLPYIAKTGQIKLFTNNIITALNAIELGIHTDLIGGHSVNGSAVLSGTMAYRIVSDLRPDILFFSSQSLDDDGVISDSTEEENYLRSLMIRRAERTVFLCDSSKFHKRSGYVLTDLSRIDHAVFDTPFPGWEKE